MALPAALFLAACGSDSQASDDSLTKVTVATAPIADYAPLYLGVEKGFFEKQGLQVEFASGRVGTETVTGVLSGTNQFAGVALLPLLVSDSQGLDVAAITPSSVAPGAEDPSTVHMLTTADSQFTSLQELEGATVAVNALQAQAELTARLAVEKAGGNPDELQFVEVPFPEMPAALQRGDVDAIVAVEPFVSTALDGGAVSLGEIDRSLSEGAPTTTFFTSAQYAQSDPEVVDKFTAAMTESVDYAAENPDEVRAIIPEYTQVSEELAQEIALPTFSSELNQEGVTETAEAMHRFGWIESLPEVGSLFEVES
jgi:NitT/TauT family transport system substrate-binding protein